MANVAVLLVAGLDLGLIERHPELGISKLFKTRGVMKPVTPAVTCTVQATLTTGVLPEAHGIISNGLYSQRDPTVLANLDLSNFAAFRKQVSFWEQSNKLLQAPRFWGGSGKKVAMLFWQQSMHGAAEVVLTPKPEHTPDGKTLTTCWSNPPGLYGQLIEKFGPFPLHKYWGPMAGWESSDWILKATRHVGREGGVDLLLSYIPLLDYNLQRFGPMSEQVSADLRTLDGPLCEAVTDLRAAGYDVIVCGDYGITAVSDAICPNLALRQAGLLTTVSDANGKQLIDYDNSAAMAMVDHQIAHVYVKEGMRDRVLAEVGGLRGVGLVLATPGAKKAHGLDSPRSGDIVLLAKSDAWFAHDWWLGDAEKPAWQMSVDIHRKPGYDPRELFFDPVHKRIAQETGRVRGSHGVVGTHHGTWPVVLGDGIAFDASGAMEMTALAGLLKERMSNANPI
jgi:hypothetical protein